MLHRVFKRSVSRKERVPGDADEVPLLCARMRKEEFGVVRDDALVVDHVDVDRARTVPDGPDASECVFERVHPVGELARREVRLEQRHLVEEPEVRKLRGHADRIRLLDGRRLDEPGRGKRRESLERPREIFRARLQVAPERDHHLRHLPSVPSCDRLHRLAREAHPERRRHGHPAALRLTRADRRLLRPDAGEFRRGETSEPFEALPQRPGESVALDLLEPRHRHARRIEPERGAHRTHERNARCGRREDELGLAVDGIDRVDDGGERRGREPASSVLRREPLRTRGDVALGIDREQSLAHRLDLRTSHVRRGRGTLAVDVRGRDRVVVDERDASEPRADQRLGAPAADAADADNEHVRRLEPRRRFRAQKRLRPFEEVIVHCCGYDTPILPFVPRFGKGGGTISIHLRELVDPRAVRRGTYRTQKRIIHAIRSQSAQGLDLRERLHGVQELVGDGSKILPHTPRRDRFISVCQH